MVLIRISDEKKSRVKQVYRMLERWILKTYKVVQEIWIGHIERRDLHVKRCGLP